MILATMLGLAAMQTASSPSSALNQGLSREPVPAERPGNWILRKDYPASALRGNESGIVGFELTVGRDGRVTACKVTESASAILDQTTCDLLRTRARFRPALDLGKKPVTSTWRSRTHWRLPPMPAQVENSQSFSTIKFDAAGIALSCDTRSPNPQVQRNFCATFAPGNSAVPLLKALDLLGAARTLVMETMMVFDGLSAAAPVAQYALPGHKLLALVQVGVAVTKEGKVQNCVRIPTGQEGYLSAFPADCGLFAAGFVPSIGPDGVPRPATGTLTIAVSTIE